MIDIFYTAEIAAQRCMPIGDAEAVYQIVRRCKVAEALNAAQAEEIGRLQNEVAEQRAYIEASK